MYYFFKYYLAIFLVERNIQSLEVFRRKLDANDTYGTFFSFSIHK